MIELFFILLCLPLVIIYVIVSIIYQAFTGKSFDDLNGSDVEPYHDLFDNNKEAEMYEAFKKALDDNETKWRTYDNNFNKKDD